MTGYTQRMQYEDDYLQRLAHMPESDPDTAEKRVRKGTACPAASACGDGVRCGIEQVVLKTANDAKTIVNLCTDDYSMCPTWRRHVHEQRTAKEHGIKLRKDLDRQEDKDNEEMERVAYDVKH